ncbi:hypothetical protein ABE073_04895 [Lederbergia citrisecunda]|uniref:hypothetical protein n=1 Tax=Lederbergia citrisecunda TaxID=2833583 RepID=UPI003D2B9CF9
MEIVVDAKIKFDYAKSSFCGDALRLTIKYKLPYRKLKTKDTRCLCYSGWDKYDSYEMFQEDVLSHIKDRDIIEKEVIDTVKNRIKADNRNNEKYAKDDEIQKLLKGNKKLTFKVKINE